jgi:hypothetical protein
MNLIVDVSLQIEKGFRSAMNLPDNDIQQDNGQDDRAFNVVVQTERQDHSDQEYKCKGIGDLSQENLEHGNPFSILDLVGSILRKAICRFIVAKAMTIRVMLEFVS